MSDTELTHTTIGDDAVEITTFVEVLLSVVDFADGAWGWDKLDWQRPRGIQAGQTPEGVLPKTWLAYRISQVATIHYTGSLGAHALKTRRIQIGGATYRHGEIRTREQVEELKERSSGFASHVNSIPRVTCNNVVRRALNARGTDVFITMPSGYDEWPLIAPFYPDSDTILEEE